MSRHVPPRLVRFGWLTGVWHTRVQFGGSVPALLQKVLSAGECGVKPRGFGPGILLSPLCLFHQHMCSVKPWPSPCHMEYLPPLLDVVSHQCTVGTGVVLLR